MPARLLRTLLVLAFGSAASLRAYIPPPSPVSTTFPAINGEVCAVAIVESESGESLIYIGGKFTQVGDQTRNHAAAFDLRKGTLTSWNPNIDGAVYALSVVNGAVYLGGSFSQVGGQSRNNLASVAADTGAVSGWNPDANGSVQTICAVADNIYVGGAFTTIGGQSRSGLAQFAAASLTLQPWNPGADGDIHVLSSTNGILYAGGDFQNIAGTSRPFAAAFNIADGALAAWNPAPNAAVRAFAFEDSTVFAGGDFTLIGGTSHPHVAALDASSGAAAATWNPGIEGSVRALALHTHILYLGGDFTRASGLSRPRMAAVNSRTGHLYNWNPGADGSVNALQFVGQAWREEETLLIGGAFASLDGKAQAGFTGARDPLWSRLPAGIYTHINGRPRRKVPSRYLYWYFVTSAHLRLQGRAVAGLSAWQTYQFQERGKLPHILNGEAFVDKVVIQHRRKATLARGTNRWSASFRLKFGGNRFYINAVDNLGRDSIPIDDNPTFAELIVFRLRPGEKAPSQ